MPDPSHATPGAPSRSVLTDTRLRALLAVCLFTYVAQNMLNVSVAPLSRSLGLHEWVVGLAVSSAALTVTVLSQFWGRRSVAWGLRRVLITALSLAVGAGCLFALAVALRAHGLLGTGLTAALIVVARGPLFGGAVAAIPPAGQALIAQITPDQASRVRGMSAFSGSVQLAIVLGSLASSALGAWSIYAPVHATPVAVVLALAIGWLWLPREEGGAAGGGRERVPALPPRVSWHDRRVSPWVGSAFGLFFTSGMVQITAGFLVQDRLGLAPHRALGMTAVMLLANAAGATLTQLLLVPRLGWAPERLVRIGSTTALVALGALWAAPGLWLMAASTLLIGVGAGLLGPGFTAGGSLSVSAAEQGGIAGLLQATAASTWILAPVTATALYAWQPAAPFALSGAVLASSTAVAWIRLGPARHSPSRPGL
ncbi:MFS transporter [Actinomyces bowdenii]|uniref:MFS transporter n=1 Tax=Actinomyces bowdenii TaxID=131109 RepID=UPI00214C4BF2|nr:MFS transporter [Actinomyces bowdenii]